MKTEYLNNKVFEGIIDRFQRSKKSTIKYELMMEDLQETIKNKTKKKLDIEREETLLKKNIIEYQEIRQNFYEAEQSLTTAFYTLSENLVRFAKFNLIDADDTLQEGVVICFEKIDRFDARKGKAFNYFTTCCLNHYRQLYRSARNYNELKRKYHDFLNFCENRMIIKNGKEIPFYH
jgi:hypothetical protein